MSAGTLIARKSIRARWGRMLAILLAITASVSFVAGSFVLADSLRATFTNLFQELGEHVDLQVRGAQEFETQNARDPIPLSIADDLAAVDGLAVIEPIVERYAQVLDADGEIIATQGAPTLGVSWLGEGDIEDVAVREGRLPVGADEVAIDRATANRADLTVGERIQYITDTGRHEATLVGLIGLGSGDSFGGAQVVVLDLETALERFGAGNLVDYIDIQVADGFDVTDVEAAIAAMLPPNTEVVPGEQVAEEIADSVNQFVDAFGTGLLIFAFVTAFVSAFIINNVFQITIGQRLRELALLRAIGGSGRQVRRMITNEALGLGIVATILGIGGGVLVARGLIAVFDAAGAGFPDTSTVIALRTIVVATLVGVGITLASAVVPARRAATIPPIAAMRPELGFDALQTRRLVVGAVVTLVGVAMFLLGIFARPGGAVGLIVLAGGGALLLFLGVASLSSTVAGPVTRVLGWPIEKLFKVPGALARENVARAPRRTASSASALMIGVALVSCAAVFASSLRVSLLDTLEEAFDADLVITDPSFQGLPPAVTQALAAIPEIGAVTPVRAIAGQIDGNTKNFGAIDPAAFEQVVDPDIREGAITDLGLGGVLVHRDSASDLDLTVGSTVDVVYQNGVRGTLTVAGVFGDATFGNWLIDIATLEEVSDAPARDFFVLAKFADGVDPDVGVAAAYAALVDFPQADVQTIQEFTDANEAQINQLLVIISTLLAFAIIIAILGISITLALGVFERTREIGLLRAIGMNRRQIRRSVRWEAVIVSTFGALIGVVVGTFLGVVLTLAVPPEVINRLAFNPGLIVAILVAAVIAGLIAALYPSFKASNMNVLDAIATE